MDKSTSFGGESDIKEIDGLEFVETKLDDSSIKRRIGRDIYTDLSAAFKEMLSNGFSGITEAIQQGFITETEGKITINVESQKDTDQLLFEFIDNGIGMPESVVDDEFVVFGKSLNGTNNETIGTFGMGVSAYPQLVGFEKGKIYIETKFRETSELTNGWYTIDGVYKHENPTPEIFSETEYGTGYRAWLKEDISITDVKNWVDEYCQHNPYQVELTINGNTNTYAPQDIKEGHNSTVQFEIEHDLFELVAGSNIDSETVVIHQTMSETLKPSNTKFKNNIAIKLLTEKPTVCTGEHKGKIVVEDERYEMFDESKQENYVRSSEIDESVPITPEMVGNRESLKISDTFEEYIGVLISNETEKKLKEICSIIEEGDYLSLTNAQKRLLDIAITRNTNMKYTESRLNLPRSSHPPLKKRINNHTPEDYEPSEDLLQILHALYDCDVIKNKPRTNKSYSTIRGKDIYNTHQDNVYIGCSANEKKINAIREHSFENVFVRVESASCYNRYQEAFGWKLLKNVKKDVVKNMNVSMETKKEFGLHGGTKNSSSGTGSHVIHFGRKQRNKKRVNTSELTNQFERKVNEALVVFLPDSSENLSDYYDYASDDYGLVNLSTSEYEHIKDNPNVYTIDEIITQHSTKEYTLNTGESVSARRALTDNNIGVCIISDSLLPINLPREKIADRILALINERNRGFHRKVDTFTSFTVISPTTLQETKFASPTSNSNTHIFCLKKGDVSVNISNEIIHLTGYNFDMNRFRNTLMFCPWRDTKVFEDIVDKKANNLLEFVYTNLNESYDYPEFSDISKR